MAIFSTCSMFGFVVDIMVRGRQPVAQLVLTVIVSGLLGVGYAIVSMPLQPPRMIALMAAHAAYVALVPRLFPVLPATPNGRLLVDGMGSILTVVIGCSSFLRFMDVTATRYLRAQAEIALARDIHRVLAPEVRRTLGDYEFFGWSVASGDVGGDLVDLVETPEGWLGYVADVSGHGVGSGVVMGMFDDATFESRVVHSKPGDLIAILTDGLVEVFDAAQRELGFDWAKQVVREHASAPLADIADRLITGARRHGTQADDQTLLLIRRNRP